MLCVLTRAQDPSGVGLTVWEGALARPEGGEFFVACTQHGGPRAVALALPPTLQTVGRLKYTAVADFMPQVWCAIESYSVFPRSFHN